MVTWVRSAGSPPHFVLLSQDDIFIAQPMEATVVEAVGSGVVHRCRSTIASAPYTTSPKKEKKMGEGESAVLGADLQLARVGFPWGCFMPTQMLAC
jgi:hypothetical protein